MNSHPKTKHDSRDKTWDHKTMISHTETDLVMVKQRHDIMEHDQKQNMTPKTWSETRHDSTDQTWLIRHFICII